LRVKTRPQGHFSILKLLKVINKTLFRNHSSLRLCVTPQTRKNRAKLRFDDLRVKTRSQGHFSILGSFKVINKLFLKITAPWDFVYLRKLERIGRKLKFDDLRVKTRSQGHFSILKLLKVINPTLFRNHSSLRLCVSPQTRKNRAKIEIRWIASQNKISRTF
jgi:hypothetical protein